MEYGIVSTVFVIIIFLLLKNEGDKQKALEGRNRILGEQKHDLCLIIRFMLDLEPEVIFYKEHKNIFKKIKTDLSDLINDLRTGYSNDEEIQEKLDRINRRFDALEELVEEAKDAEIWDY